MSVSNILKSISERLDKSSNAGFTNGSLDEWYEFAQTMQTTIDTIVPIVDNLVPIFEDMEKRVAKLEAQLVEKDALFTSLAIKASF